MVDDEFELPSAEAASVRLGGVVLEWLSQAILDGRLKVGDPLPAESRLAAAFGVSKPVVREAVRELVALGVVHIQQGKVARVRAVDAAPLVQFFRFAVSENDHGLADANELRKLIEPQAAVLAARRGTAADQARLTQTIAAIENSVGRPEAFTDADIAFHEAIAAMTGNRLLSLQMQGLRSVIRGVSQILTMRPARTTQEWDATVQRHRAIYEAIIARDEARASSAMLEHFGAADAAIDQLAASWRSQRGETSAA
ncbi:FadR/GntR family transcriptional regulator [Devosia yakushimensis]|uniref:FadR/GntR family transcriptional regulator n=1 Tax=Devosia yakushimensis TaxID=470028 RepID=UPI0024E13069|nr:FadR/GntR family transcriptional regulator [Devosia yakushimensis]